MKRRCGWDGDPFKILPGDTAALRRCCRAFAHTVDQGGSEAKGWSRWHVFVAGRRRIRSNRCAERGYAVGGHHPAQITLSEEEIADVSLGTFYVFDKEHAGTPVGERFAQRCGGCRGCGRGAGRAGAQGDDDYDVIGTDGIVIGRIKGRHIACGDTLDVDAGLRTHGYEATRQAATHSFARSWHRET